MSKSEDPLDESMTVVRSGTCETLTRKSKLTYQIGTLPDGEVYLRIHKNTGNGFFSREWISLSDIQKAIRKIPAGKPVTAIVLGNLFEGRSVNTPGFLLASLVEEKLLVPMQGKKRSHEPVSPEEFRERVSQSMRQIVLDTQSVSLSIFLSHRRIEISRLELGNDGLTVGRELVVHAANARWFGDPHSTKAIHPTNVVLRE